MDEKVLFMHEIARLHATCGNTHKCSKYLTAAVEILGTDKKAMKCTLREEEVHSQVLHAAYVDIGYLFHCRCRCAAECLLLLLSSRSAKATLISRHFCTVQDNRFHGFVLQGEH